MVERQAGSVLETRPRTEGAMNLMRTDDIRDLKAQNPEGENLGEVGDIAIDRDTGCIAYAVLSYGGILGFGEKHFAIPWEAIRIRPEEGIAVIDADKQTFESNSGYTRDRIPREGDWSLVRTVPAAAATAATAATAAKSMRREEERDIPQPAVQTVAAGWGGQQKAHPAEEAGREYPAEREAHAPTPEPTMGTRERAGAERPVTATGKPSLAHLSAADLQTYLKGMDYPAGKRDLVAHARKNNAPEDVIAALEGFGEQTYQSAADVSVEFGKEGRRGAPAGGRLSAVGLQTYLKGMDYPAGKRDLVAHARKNNAPEDVIAALEGFGERTYQSAADVSVEFGKESRTERPVETATRSGKTGAAVGERPPETRRRAPSLAHLSAADLQVYLKGMDYPADKQNLITHARGMNAPEDVIAALELFSERTYQSAADVGAEFGIVK
jgi:sporulation protein YlmC with PRC-barrel domain